MDNINMNQMPGMPGTQQKKSSGPLIAVIIILLLIIIGGIYFLGQRINRDYGVPTQSDQITDSLKSQSSSDSLDSIEADLNATQIDNLDQGAAALESQLQ